MERHEAQAHWFCRHDDVDVYCTVCHAHDQRAGITIDMVFEVSDEDE